QLLVMQVEAGDLEVAAEPDPLLGEGQIHGRVDAGVLRLQHRGRQDVGDLVQREALRAQAEGAVGRAVDHRGRAVRGPQRAASAPITSSAPFLTSSNCTVPSRTSTAGSWREDEPPLLPAAPPRPRSRVSTAATLS